jgi:Tfp pilus assembly protein PilV
MKVKGCFRSRKHERGMSLLETIVAATVMLIGIGGVMALFSVAGLKNASQGTQATRTTEYAQDKMEQLMALQFSDSSSDTTVVPTSSVSTCVATTCTGLGGALAAGASVGSTYPNAVTVGYVDYVTEGTGTGSAIYSTKQSNSAYMRQWSIAANSTDANIKTITVTVVSLRSVDQGPTPATTLVSRKTNF